MVRRLFLVSMIAATACSFPEQPLPPGNREFVVHAILDPSLRYQVVRLSMTDGSKISAGELDDAVVSIATPDGTILFARQDSSRDTKGKAIAALPDYRIDLQSAGVTLQPGGTYDLRVVMRSGATITGEATIPSAAPATVSSQTDFHRLSDTLRLTWARVAGARTYEVQVWSTRTYNVGVNNSSTNRNYTAFVDTSLTLAGTAKGWDENDVFPANSNGYSFTTQVHVYAVDDHYYEYYRLLGDPFIGAAPSRLTGGLGVFGAIVPLVLRDLTIK